MTDQKGRVAVVTGAAGGLGAAFAERLAADGASVAIVDIKPCDAVVGRITAAGGTAKEFICDLTDPDAVEGLGKAVLDHFGRCDILINNAGRYENRNFDDLTFADWRSVMALNLDAMFLVTKQFAADMRGRGWGRIINVASNSTFLAPPGMPQYIASKSGAIGLARALGSEFGPDGVTVNAIAPGPIETEQLRASYASDINNGSEEGFDDFMGMLAANQAIKKGGKPSDVVGLVSFLCGDEAGFITTQTIVCDGGWARV